jgi:peptide/nickel transport system substrate-binding protein
MDRNSPSKNSSRDSREFKKANLGNFDSEDRRDFIKKMGLTAIVGSGGALAGCAGNGNSNGNGNSGSSDGNGEADLAGRGSDDFGEPVEIKFDFPELLNYPDHGRAIANLWEAELGIVPEMVTTSWGTYLDMVWIGQGFDQWAWTGFGGSPERFHPQFFLSVPTEDQPLNVSSYSDPEYEEMYEEFTQTVDVDEQIELAKEMQRFWHENIVSPVSYAWPVNIMPYDSENWDIEPTKLVGASSESTMTLITAEPTGDDTTLLMGGQEVNQRPNVVAPTANAMDWFFRIAYDTCVRLDLDGNFVNWALSDIEQIDGQTYDLTLREDMEFHDGEPVTAEDLQFTFEFLSEYTFGKIDEHVEPIESVDLETDLTARVNLNQRWATFTTNTLVYSWILPRHIWEDVPDQSEEPVNWTQEVGDDPPGDWVASGPFKVRSVSPERIEFEAYDDHFSGYPNYDGIIYQTLGSQEALRSELVEDNIDISMGTPSTQIARLAEEQADHISTTESNSFATQCYSFNTQEPPGDDLVFRKATRKVLPVDEIIEVHRRGAAIESDSTYIHPEHPVFESVDLPTVSEMRDPEEARVMLEEAGYAWDEEGRLRYPQ